MPSSCMKLAKRYRRVTAASTVRANRLHNGAMIADQPVWLLDVDGVINANRPGWGAPPRRESVWSPTDRQSYLLRWAPALIDRIRDLHARGAVEVRWCTTWCHEASILENLWRLPVLARAITVSPMPRGSDCWPHKIAAAQAVLDAGRRLIWTDDEAIPAGFHDPRSGDRPALQPRSPAGRHRLHRSFLILLRRCVVVGSAPPGRQRHLGASRRFGCVLPEVRRMSAGLSSRSSKPWRGPARRGHADFGTRRLVGNSSW